MKPRDQNAIRETAAEDKKAADMAEKSRTNDAIEALAIPAVRRLVRRFWEELDIDSSPFDTNAMSMARNAGHLEAGWWWLKLIRKYCPEREAQVRNERLVTPTPDQPKEDDDDV